MRYFWNKKGKIPEKQIKKTFRKIKENKIKEGDKFMSQIFYISDLH